MWQSLRSKVTAYLAASLFALAIGTFWVASSDTASAYSGAQAEAQSDPYAFPNIDLCCKPKPPAVPYCARYPNAPRCICRRDPNDPVCYKNGDWDNGENASYGRSVTVDCGAGSHPRAHVFTSLQDAVDSVRPWTTIRVRGGFPGGDCREHVRIEKPLTIEGDGGSPAIVNGCVTITGTRRPVVRLRNLQILGTTTGLAGTDCQRQPAHYTGFDGRHYPQPINGDHAVSALSVAGSTLYGENLLVRSAEAALDVEQSIVTLNGSTLAANPGAGFSVRLERAEVKFNGTVVAGGEIGVFARMLDRHPMTFDDVQLQPARSQYGEPSRGLKGVVVSVIDEGLPALPQGPGGAAAFVWNGGSVQGFGVGFILDSGVSASVRRARIVGAARGFSVRPGASVYLAENTIEWVGDVGIDVARGALGSAQSNNVSRKKGRGDCFCVGGDCDDDDDDIKARPFVLSGNVCHRESWVW